MLAKGVMEVIIKGAFASTEEVENTSISKSQTLLFTLKLINRFDIIILVRFSQVMQDGSIPARFALRRDLYSKELDSK